MLLPGDVVDFSPFFSSLPSSPSSSFPYLYQVAPPPASLSPFTISLSGPSSLLLPSPTTIPTNDYYNICWKIKTENSGERGVNYTITSPTDPILERTLQYKNIGWVGAGWGEVCIEEWEGLKEGMWEEKEYSFQITAESILFQTTTTTNHSFYLSYSPPPPSSSSSVRSVSRSLPSCSPPLLWDTTTPSLFGIVTYPSLSQPLPSSLRSSPLTITTKALSPCPTIGMSKDILIPFDFNWTLMDPIPDGLVDVDANDWSVGGTLVIPSEVMEDRTKFPMNVPVTIQVYFLF